MTLQIPTSAARRETEGNISHRYPEACAAIHSICEQLDTANAAIGTLRSLAGCVDRNVSDVSYEQHTREIGAVIRTRLDQSQEAVSLLHAEIARINLAAVDHDAMLRSQIAKVEAQRDAAVKERASQAAEVARLTKDNENLLINLKEWDADIGKVQAQRDAAVKERDYYKTDAETSRQRRLNADDEINRLHNERKRCDDTITALRERLVACEGERDQFMATLAATQCDNTVLETSLVELGRVKGILQAAMEYLADAGIGSELRRKMQSVIDGMSSHLLAPRAERGGESGGSEQLHAWGRALEGLALNADDHRLGRFTCDVLTTIAAFLHERAQPTADAKEGGE